VSPGSAPFALAPWLEVRRTLVEGALAGILSRYARAEVPTSLCQAMEHSLMAPGKRLRPVLVLAAAEVVGGAMSERVLDFACALEMVHTYSLIHDDLPSMDNDDLRRGRPTCHKAFGEALAILAGDALLTEAFAQLGRGADPVRAELGMVGGQADDIRADGQETLQALESLHRRKTGALIEVACVGGARAAQAPEREVELLAEYGRRVGLAFQIRDDLMDQDGDPKKTGKAGGGDQRRGKVTFPSLIGAAAAWKRARDEAAAAKRALEPLLPRSEALCALADFAVEREK
jgi:geranylgeranyl diphosphate synthase type II